jgi:hypothetical protein
LLVIQTLLILNVSSPLPVSDDILRDTLFEYLMNQNNTFRGHQVAQVLENLCTLELNEKLASSLLHTLNQKVKQIAMKPAFLSREESEHEPNHSLV